jgi:hypothetical protein
MRIASIFTSVLLAALLLSTLQSMAQEEIYRWVDKDGVVHFGDQPGEQVDAELVEIKAPPENPAQPYSEPKPTDTDNSEPSYAQQQRDERARKRKEAEQRKAESEFLCAQARQVEAKLEPMPRVIVTREDGSTYRMDDNDRLEKLAKAKQLIAENCDD